MDPAAAGRFAGLALKCLHDEYPNHISLTMDRDSDAHPPRELTPAFYGCFDWHSDVHGHWLLVRLLRLMPNAPFAARRAANLRAVSPPKTSRASCAIYSILDAHRSSALTDSHGCSSCRRSYASGTIRRPDNGPLTLQPLEAEAASRLKSWLPKLHYPIRIGEHDQTAFSFGLVWDWAGVAGDAEMRALLNDAARRFYVHDRHCPLSYEPSGEDFLSPCLAEADFMRRVLETKALRRLVGGFSAGNYRRVRASSGCSPAW